MTPKPLIGTVDDYFVPFASTYGVKDDFYDQWVASILGSPTIDMNWILLI